MDEEGFIETVDISVQLDHVFGHFTKVWHGRDDQQLGERDDESHPDRSEFPDYLTTVGRFHLTLCDIGPGRNGANSGISI